jgi:hypothetical protein
MGKIALVFFILFFLAGCAAAPAVRQPMHEDLNVPAGRIEGNQFTGIRYPFKISAPSPWKMTTEFPGFLVDFGYDKPTPFDKEQTELYIFNPVTQSSVQVDFSPANPGYVASQKGIETLVGLGANLVAEDWGKEGVRVEIGPTEAISLKGVQYAAKKSVTYTLNGVKHEQGWIYGFSEPYQIFVLYMIVEKPGSNDRQDLKTILDSFEVLPGSK